MIDRTPSPLAAALACLALLCSLPAALAGQGTRNAPTFLALPDDFPGVPARVVLLREPGRNVVVLNAADSGPEALSAALGLLRRKASEPLRPGQAEMIPMTGFVLSRPLRQAERQDLEAALTRLRAAPAAFLGTLGTGRSVLYTEP